MNVTRPIAMRQRGFTLIELVLGVAIMAIVLIAINAVFFGAMRLRERTTAAVDEALPLEHTLAVLRRDLQGAMPPSTDGILSGSFKAGSIVTVGAGGVVDIEFHTTTGVLRPDEPWGEVQKVGYVLSLPEDRRMAGHNLIRRVTRNLLATFAPEPEDQLMMSGVESIEFSCFDGVEWRNDWDTSLTDTNLPGAVRIRLHLAGGIQGEKGRSVEMIVPISSQSRATVSASDSGS